MKGGRRVVALVIAAAIAAPAVAQTATDGEKFVGMVRDGDGNGALALLQTTPIVLNSTNSRGETALLVAVRNRDSAWTAHLLKSGANPNLAARNGDTPLIVAARGGFTDAARWLIGAGAKVDGTNRAGETALIAAVQGRFGPLVRFLVSAGADPDHTDTAAGLSARDYAKRETRYPELLTAIESGRATTKAPAKPVSDKLDDFRLD